MPITSASRSCPGNLYSRPTLIWSLDNAGRSASTASKRPISPAKLSWNADYVLTVGARRQDRRSRRLGDADQRQRHVVQERDAAAGRRRSEPRPADDRRRWRDRMARRVDGRRRQPPMTQESFSDYHLYTLGRKTTHQQQRDQAGQHARRAPASRCASATSSTARPSTTATPQHPGSPLKDVVAGLLPVQERAAAPGSACRCRPASCASIRPTRKAACSSSARIASTTRRRTRRSTSRSATPSTSCAERKQVDFEKIASNVYEMEYESHAAQPQGRAGHRRSERADRRHLADASAVARMDEDRRLGGAVRGAGRGRRRGDAEVSGQGHLLTGRGPAHRIFGATMGAVAPSRIVLSTWGSLGDPHLDPRWRSN